MFEKLADFIIKNAKKIVIVWIIALLISAPFILSSSSVLQYDMSKMKTSSPLESVKGQEMLSSGEFNSGGNLSAGTIIIVEAYDNLAPEIASAIKSNLEENIYFWDHNKDLRSKYGIDCEVTVTQLGRFDDKYFADSNTQMIIYVVNYPTIPDVKSNNSIYVPEIRSIVKESTSSVDGVVGTYVTGTDAISYDTRTGSTNDLKHIDPISVLLVLILIGLFFRSFVAAGTPPIIIGMAYGILLALVFAIGSVLGIYYITTILVLVSMLGAGCDYCIFIISRYREERKEGKEHLEALRESIIWAGESIITSGISVMIGFGSLMLCSFSLVSTMGLVLALGILLALLAALTFIPSILRLVGDKIFWPSNIPTYQENSKAMQGWYGKCAKLGHRYFTHSAQSAIKYAKVIFAVTILITVPLAYFAVTSNPSYDMIGAMPDSEAKDGVAIISDNLGGGLLMPTNVTMKVDAFVDLNVNSNISSGSIIPAGSKVTLEASPHTGYLVKGWVIGGEYHDSTYDDATYGHIEIDTDSKTCTIDSFAAAMDVTAVYAKAEYTLEFSSDDDSKGTVSAKVNGIDTISGLGISFANDLKFTARPADNYHVDHWTISRDGTVSVLYSHDEVLEIDRASYDYNVVAYFAENTDATHKVNYTVGEHGKIAVRADDELIDSGADVAHRAHVVISAIADDGYKVKKIVINSVEYTDPQETIPYLEADTDIQVEFEVEPVKTYTVTFAADGDGTVTATSNGNPITSGSVIDEKSRIVITAAPGSGKVVIGWKYYIPDPIGEYITSYINKTEHVITSLSSDTNITVIFGEEVASTVNVTAVANDPANSSVVMMKNNTVIPDGAVTKGSDLFLTATVKDGYHIKKWTIDNGSTQTVTTTNKNLSIYNLSANTTFTVYIEADNYYTITYGSNDETLGSLNVTCDSLTVPYSERSNASATLEKLNGFAQSLMSMETNGKKNVALAIGPINGDILFDGEHEWIFDTIWNILPRQYQSMIGTGQSYDALMYLWSLVPYENKQILNNYIAYKTGLVSDVFTEEEGGHEYQYVKFIVVTKDEPMSALSVDTIKQIYEQKDTFMEQNSAEDGGFVYEASISGAAVSNYEMSELVNKDFHFIIVVVIVLLIALLFFVMRSYLTPIRAVMTIVMSVIWTLGLTYILFEHILGTPVVWIVPIVLFVICLGLGMDYDILLTTRIKEHVTKGYSNDDAIVAAVQKSGAVITICGLIMAGAFGTMMLSTSPMLTEFGFALGFAIAIDALVIRTYIVPAIMHLMGDWNWKGPDFGALKNKILRKKTEE